MLFHIIFLMYFYMIFHMNFNMIFHVNFYMNFHMIFHMNRLLRIGLPYGLFILFMIGVLPNCHLNLNTTPAKNIENVFEREVLCQVPPLMIRSPLSAAQYVQDEAQYCINDW